ncbi:MAG: Outer membrane protein H precursor [Candidatus Saccharicenans subterraneus]|uniref:Outer membrane protein H n=1 Tax=Candidatus Saccharicenans subterraneus TaxID=2508984 RepID=A0A3E2BKA4_9BACT|nr:MAG: Outer membrane protein H precursor [Candidatus Saccharicenans subterraneum]
MRRILTAVLLLAVMLIAGSHLALAQQSLKVGVINSQEILEKSAEGKKAIAQLEEKNRKTQQDLAKLDDQIRQLESRLSTQQLTMTQEAILSLSVDLDRKRTERQRMAEDAQKDMQELTQRLYMRIQSEVMPIINKLGQEKGLDLILDLRESGVLFFSPAVDLTQEVIKRYDASKAPAK